jgi:hypothetical protein
MNFIEDSSKLLTNFKTPEEFIDQRFGVYFYEGMRESFQ